MILTRWQLVNRVFCAIACFVFATNGFAGTFLIDFNADGTVEPPGSTGLSLGTAPGWDGFPQLIQDRAYPLTDFAGIDNDVTITALDDSFDPNNPGPPNADTSFDGFPVPQEAVNDYLFKRADTPGTTARMVLQNLDPGDYRVYVFEGRLTDPSQFAKVWAGDSLGSNEPADQNTGNFAAGYATVELTVQPGESLWYKHLEDGTGGISGMIVLQLSSVPEPASGAMLLVAFLTLAARRRVA
jgi:hypothetical protein